MIDKIIGTLFSRLFAMIIMLIIVVINTNTFGAEGTGTIGLIILGLTILQIVGNFIGGSIIVYLVPRRNYFQILFLSYFWAILSNLLGLIMLIAFQLIPKGYEIHLLILSLSSSFFFIHLGVMQGKEDIKRFNFYQIAQLALLITIYLFSLLIFSFINKKPTVELYISIFALSYFLPTIVSFRFVFRFFEKIDFSGMKQLLIEMGKLGFWVQLANLTQLMNYRLSYYFIERFAGRQPLGLFELGTKLSEVVWIFPKSICLVQYARIANKQEPQYAKNLTLTLFKIVAIFSILAISLLLLIPAHWLAYIFGPEFSASKTVILRLSPGIFFLAMLSILAHYFAGYGKYWINSIASIGGFVITLILGLIFIPQVASISTIKTIETAATISSISYFVSFIVTLIFFILKSKSSFVDFLLTKKDILFFKKEIIYHIKSKLKEK